MPDSINEQHTFAPHDVAGMFGVSVMTVRRWADYHKSHLSNAANPPAGKARAFTWADVEKLRQVKAWRDAGLSVEAINNRLSGNVTEAITPTVIPDRLDAIQTAQNTPDSTPANIVGQDYLMSIERRFEAMQASIDEVKQAPVATHSRMADIVLGVLLALGFMVVILLLAVLYGK